MYCMVDWIGGQVDQIGTVTEIIEAVKVAKDAGWGVIASHCWYVIYYYLLI